MLEMMLGGDGLLLGIVGIFILIIVFTIFILNLIQKVPPNEAMSIYGLFAGKKDENGNFRGKYVTNGGVLVIPVLQQTQRLSLASMNSTFALQGAIAGGASNGVRVNLELNSSTKIAGDANSIQLAFQRFGGMMVEDIEKIIIDILTGQVRGVVAQMSIEEMNKDRTKLQQLIFEECKSALAQFGVVIDNLTIKDIKDDNKYIESLAQQSLANVMMETRIRQAEADKIARQKEAEATREAQEIEAENRRKSELAKIEADKQIEIEKQKAERLRGEAQKEKEVALQQYRAEVAIEEAKSQQSGIIAETQQKQILAVEEEKVLIERAKQKQILAVEEQKIESRKQEELVNVERAKASVQEQTFNANVVIPAQKQAEAEKIKAQGLANAIIEKARGEKESTIQMAEAFKTKKSLEGAGEAEAILAIATAKAEGEKKMVDVLNSTNDASIKFMAIEKLIPIIPSAIGEATKHIASIDKFTVIGGGGSQPSDSLMDMPANAVYKTLESFKAFGVDPGIFTSVLGFKTAEEAYENKKTEKVSSATKVSVHPGKEKREDDIK